MSRTWAKWFLKVGIKGAAKELQHGVPTPSYGSKHYYTSIFNQLQPKHQEEEVDHDLDLEDSTLEIMQIYLDV